MTIEYDGTDFHGWQTQPNLRTVQGEIEKAVERITGEKVVITGAGRTDAGVHAEEQTASFSLNSSDIKCEKLLYGINALTGKDLTVHTLQETNHEFNARYGIFSKIYHYCIDNGKFPSPLLRRTHFHVSDPLNVELMNESAKVLEGTHDFSAFKSSDCTDPNPVKSIRRCTVCKSGKTIIIEVEGNGFLKNMVRIIAGTLIQSGKGKISRELMERILDSKDRTNAGPTAPPHGLTLVKVIYCQ